MKLTIHEVAQAVGAKNDVSLFADTQLEKAEFDSRLIAVGDLFVPLKGARDGHDFIETAFENGAVVTLSEKEVANHPYILVDDVLTAFQTLAAYYLEKTGVDVFAVTGSNGKTTTKDMLAHLLSTTYKTYKTQGNYNNEIGLPYTVLHMPEGTEKLVLEMGQDHLGDIHLLSELAHPKTAIVTLVGEAHLAFFKDRSEIAKGKMQIADGMAPGSLLLVPADPIVEDYLPTDKKVVRFGQGRELEITDLNKLYLEEKSLKVNLLGRGFAWLDTGSHKNLLQASNFIETIQERQGNYVACIEEIAYKNGWIDKEQLIKLGNELIKTDYGKYLIEISEEI